MQPADVQLVFLAFGAPDILRQLALCLYSLDRVLPPGPRPAVALYHGDTMDASLPADLEAVFAVTRIPISEAQMAAWKQPTGYFFRPKTVVWGDALTRFQRPIVMQDADTVFTADPSAVWAQISPSVSLMHLHEDSFARPVHLLTRKIGRFATRQPLPLPPDGRLAPLPPETELWNSGVLGIHPDVAPHVPALLALMDALYSGYPKHNMEQIATSYLLQQQGRIVPVPMVYHYWFAKPLLNPVLPRLLADATAREHFLGNVVPVWAARWTVPNPKRRWYHRLLGLRRPVSVPPVLAA